MCNSTLDTPYAFSFSTFPPCTTPRAKPGIWNFAISVEMYLSIFVLRLCATTQLIVNKATMSTIRLILTVDLECICFGIRKLPRLLFVMVRRPASVFCHKRYCVFSAHTYCCRHETLDNHCNICYRPSNGRVLRPNYALRRDHT